MRHTAHTRILLVALLAGCTIEDDAAQHTASPPVVALAMVNGSFQAPDTIDAGLATFRFANLGAEIHYAHAVRLDSARTVPEFLAAYAEAVRTAGPRPTYITRSGGPGGTAPGDTSAVTHMIEPGNYVWICPIDDSQGIPHFARGEARTFVVRAAASDAKPLPPPEATGVIRLINFGFHLPAPLEAGHHTLRIINDGPDPHDLAMLKLEPGKTVEDVRSWLRQGEGPPPFSSVNGVAVLAPKMEAYFEAGRYR